MDASTFPTSTPRWWDDPARPLPRLHRPDRRGLPTFLHGVVDLPVTKKPAPRCRDRAGEKELEAEPGQEVALSLRRQRRRGKGARAELAVAVVDESVLALTGYRTPDLTGPHAVRHRPWPSY